MCCVVDTMWIGTENGNLVIHDALTKNPILERYLALLPGQSITSITHLPTLRQVLITRGDGVILLFDEGTQEHKLPDDSRFDNRVNSTQLPVRAVFKTPEKLPIFTSLVVRGTSDDIKTVWCGSIYEMILLVDVRSTGLGYCRKCYNRPRNDITSEDHVTDLTLMVREEEQVVWCLTRPHNFVYGWCSATETLLMKIECDAYSPSPGTLPPIPLSLSSYHPFLLPSLSYSLPLTLSSPLPPSLPPSLPPFLPFLSHSLLPSPPPPSVLPVSCICAVGNQLQLAHTDGHILQLLIPHNEVDSLSTLHGHMKTVHSMLTLGARTLPKHWRPSILGRSNVMDYLLELLGEEDIQDIHSSMVGRQTRLLVSVGCGFYGIAGKVIESLMSPCDVSDNFLLLWSM